MYLQRFSPSLTIARDLNTEAVRTTPEAGTAADTVNINISSS